MSGFKKYSEEEIFLSEWALPDCPTVYVERWEGPTCYYDIHRKSGYYRKTPGKGGLGKFQDWIHDPAFIAKNFG